MNFIPRIKISILSHRILSDFFYEPFSARLERKNFFFRSKIFLSLRGSRICFAIVLLIFRTRKSGAKQEERQSTWIVKRKIQTENGNETKRNETIRYEKTLRVLQKINREGKSFFRPQDFFIWPIWSDAFLGGGGNGEKMSSNCPFLHRKGKDGRKSNDFYWSNCAKGRISSGVAGGVKKGKWSSIATKRTFADEKYSSRVMREGTKKILLRQESLQKQKFFYKKNYFPAF